MLDTKEIFIRDAVDESKAKENLLSISYFVL